MEANRLGWTGQIASYSALCWEADASVVRLPIPAQLEGNFCLRRWLCKSVHGELLNWATNHAFFSGLIPGQDARFRHPFHSSDCHCRPARPAGRAPFRRSGLSQFRSVKGFENGAPLSAFGCHCANPTRRRTQQRTQLVAVSCMSGAAGLIRPLIERSGESGNSELLQKTKLIVAPCLIVDFSSFAMRRSWVRIPSRPPDSKKETYTIFESVDPQNQSRRYSP